MNWRGTEVPPAGFHGPALAERIARITLGVVNLPESKKQSSRTTLKDDALRAIAQINESVPNDLWSELDRFMMSHGPVEIADLHEALKDEVDLLLLKILRSLYMSNSVLLLRSAPDSIRFAALTRLKLSEVKLGEIAYKGQSTNRSSAMLFYCFFRIPPAFCNPSLQKRLLRDTYDKLIICDFFSEIRHFAFQLLHALFQFRHLLPPFSALPRGIFWVYWLNCFSLRIDYNLIFDIFQREIS